MSDLEEQLEEFESIQSIYDKDKLSFDPQLISKLISIAQKNKHYNFPNLKFTLSITKDIIIDCTLPSLYPSETSPILFIRSLSFKYSKSSLEDANNLLKTHINQQFEAGNTLLFAILDWIQENIPSVIIVANFSNNSPKPKTMKTNVNKFNFQRSFLWFHHIHRKKYKLDQLSKQFRFTGFCVTGKPGVVVVEGLDHNVNAYITELKSWSWKRMIVRHSDTQIFTDKQEFENARRYKEWIFNDIPPFTKGGMKIVYDLLKKGNLEHYYKVIVHINIPIDCTVKSNENKMDSQRRTFRYLTTHKNGVLLNVYVKVNAKKDGMMDSNGQYLNFGIAGKTIDNDHDAVNNKICEYISNVLCCSKSNVIIHRGHKAHSKCVLIQNITLEYVTNKLHKKCRQSP